MTPQALARLTEQSNRKLVELITRLARNVDAVPALDALDRYKPNIKNPAASMLRERELLCMVLEEILVKLEVEAASPLTMTPPPSRRNLHRARTQEPPAA